jgi:hypothetical protein
MKKDIYVEKDFRIPGTKIILEKGDRIRVKENIPSWIKDYVEEIVDEWVGLDSATVEIEGNLIYIDAVKSNPARGGEKEWKELANDIIDKLDIDGAKFIIKTSGPRGVVLKSR